MKDNRYRYKQVYACIGALTLLCVGAMWYGMGDGGEYRIYFLDVGQADAQLVQNRKSYFLIDVGKGVETNTELERIIGEKKYIDVIFLSHYDEDHMGGIYTLLDRYAVGAVLISAHQPEKWGNVLEYAKKRNVPTYVIDMGDVIAQGDMLIQTIWPDVHYPKADDNESSLVLKMQMPLFSALFTGDISEKIEKILMENFEVDVDVLKVPHHGSKFSSSIPFLQKTSPSIAVVEVGKNSYGHPAAETLERLEDIGSKIFRTDESGTLRVYEKNGELIVEGLR